ncbi:MAG: hypothetical protein Rsou_2076 [Candidatus Ruthia sp. Asou_11_S2]|nr:hypothetical protein [Candidatus Ruthia sp. Asou_11_S2]MBW5290793.1 hypothetical protein [Candidatus Ruthia sp. Asou_11_S2]
MSLLGNNESNTAFSFDTAPTLDWANRYLNIKEAYSEVSTIPAYGAVSFRISADVWNDLASDEQVTLSIKTAPRFKSIKNFTHR